MHREMFRNLMMERLYYMKYYEALNPYDQVNDYENFLKDEKWICIYEGNKNYDNYKIAYYPKKQIFMHISDIDRHDKYASLSEVSEYMSEESITLFNKVQNNIKSGNIFEELHKDIMESDNIPEEWKKYLTKMGQIEDDLHVSNSKRLTIGNDIGQYIPVANASMEQIKNVYLAFLKKGVLEYRYEVAEGWDNTSSHIVTYSQVQESELKGYSWNHFDDGSGGLIDSHGKRITGYDLQTQEIKLGDEWFSYKYTPGFNLDVVISESEKYAVNQIKLAQLTSQELKVEKTAEAISQIWDLPEDGNEELKDYIREKLNEEEGKMQITISNDTIDRIDADGVVVTKIPGSTLYWYLEPENILEQGNNHILVGIDEAQTYLIGPKNSEFPLVQMQGNVLGEHYIPKKNVSAESKQQAVHTDTQLGGKPQAAPENPVRQEPSAGAEQNDIKKIIISKNIVARTDADGTLVSRIPGMNQYLYLRPESIIAQDDHFILAQIVQNHTYTIGSEDPQKPARLIRGEALSTHYTYDENYDPQLKQEIRAREQQIKAKDSVQSGNAQNGNVQVQQTQQSNLNQKYSKAQFKQLKLGQKHHLDISRYWNINLSPEQMKQLRLMQENAVDIAGLGYNHPSVPPKVLEELRLGHKAGFNMNQYDWRHMAPEQIREIRLGLEHGVDVSKFAFRVYNAAQMKQLRLGLQNGLDITAYRNPRFTDKQMYSMRCSQLFERIKEKLKELFESIKAFFRNSSLTQIRAKAMDKITQGLDRTVDALSKKEMVQGPFRNQQVPEETLDDRIQETIRDIKEMLVSQELVSEDILTDKKLSEQMNDRIRQALDTLMQPENIQNAENQEQIIAETAEEVIRTAGAELPLPDKEQTQQLESQIKEVNPEFQNEWEGLNDKELFDKIAEEMRLEAQAEAMDQSMEMVM